MRQHSDGFQVASCHCILWQALFWHSPGTKIKKHMLKYAEVNVEKILLDFWLKVKMTLPLPLNKVFD